MKPLTIPRPTETMSLLDRHERLTQEISVALAQVLDTKKLEHDLQGTCQKNFKRLTGDLRTKMAEGLGAALLRAQQEYIRDIAEGVAVTLLVKAELEQAVHIEASIHDLLRHHFLMD